MKIRHIIFLAVAFLVMGSAAARAADNTLVIAPFEGGGQDDKYQEFSEGIPELLKACLTPYSDSVVVLERTDLNKITDEQSLRFDGAMNQETVASLGRLYSAGLVLSGSYFVTPDNILHVQGGLFGAQEGVLRSSIESHGPVGNLVEICNSLAAEISRDIGSGLPQPPATFSGSEVDHFFLDGLGYYYNGHYSKAISSFMKVLKRDQGNAEARFWLGRSYYESGLKESARIEFKKLLAVPDFHRIEDVSLFLKELASVGGVNE
jgi:tetratricopeptide (TPR) repeat protein